MPTRLMTGGRSWLMFFFLGIITSLLGVTMAIFMLVWLAPYLNEPLQVRLVDAGISAPLCPGDKVTSTLETTTKGSLTVNIYEGFSSPNSEVATEGKVLGTLLQPPGVRHTYKRSFTWAAPDDLEPGDYLYVRGYYVLGAGLPTVYLLVPFQLSADCPMKEVGYGG